MEQVTLARLYAMAAEARADEVYLKMNGGRAERSRLVQKLSAGTLTLHEVYSELTVRAPMHGEFCH